jgi:hypothetical protein
VIISNVLECTKQTQPVRPGAKTSATSARPTPFLFLLVFFLLF